MGSKSPKMDVSFIVRTKIILWPISQEKKIGFIKHLLNNPIITRIWKFIWFFIETWSTIIMKIPPIYRIENWDHLNHEAAAWGLGPIYLDLKDICTSREKLLRVSIIPIFSRWWTTLRSSPSFCTVKDSHFLLTEERNRVLCSYGILVILGWLQ